MALIICPECQQQISDQATSCPKCGYPLNDNTLDETPTPDSASISTPVEPESKPVPQNKKKPIIIGCIAVICAVLIGVFGSMAKKNADERAAEQAAIEARNEYIANLNSFLYESLSGAADAESVCNLTRQVWYDTIYENNSSETSAYTKTNGKFNDDFNTSLRALYSSDGIIESLAVIEDNQATVDELYKALQNPTDEFKTCYDIVDEMYSVYYKLTNLALSPTGSLKTYTEDFSDYDSDFLEYYNKLKLLIPEE